MEKACPADSGNKPAPQYCRAAGMCLCDAAGMQLRKFCDSCAKCVKTWAPAHTPQRVELKDGKWCLSLRGTRAVAPAAGVGEDTLEIFAHMSYQVL